MDYFKRGKRLGKEIAKAFEEYGVQIKIVEMKFIASLHRYIFEIRNVPGTSIRTIMNHSEDVQVALGLPLLHLFKEGTHIRLAVSMYDIKENHLLKILRSPVYRESAIQVPYAIGYDLWGNMCIADLVKLRHLLIVGPTGTGKSVALRCIVMSIIVRCPVSSVNLLLFDIDGGSLSLFGNVPHLSHPIVKDSKTSLKVLGYLEKEMKERLARGESELQCEPYLVCIMDEVVSTISNIGDPKEQKLLVQLINNLLRMGRKAKIIVILATQDPTLKSVRVDLSGIVARIAFQCSKHHHSSTALGIVGAEKLPGDGALIFKDQKGVQSLQVAFITPEEIEKILSTPPVGYDDSNKFVIDESEARDMQPAIEIAFGRNALIEKDTAELSQIILWALKRDTISANQIRQEFHIGNRAGDIVEELHSLGIVGEKFANQPRTVLPKSMADLSPEAIEILSNNGIPVKDNICIDQK